MADSCSVEDFYRGQSVLLTGATGFMGKVVMDKLLRCCELDTLYVLIRTKKGVPPAERFAKLFADPLYARLRTEKPDFLQHVRAVAGDVSAPKLGLSDEDWQLLVDKLTLVIHGAATVRFDEVLSSATAINVNGTGSVLELARECRHLRVLVHVSTAYSHCYLHRIEERLYDMSSDYEKLRQVPSENMQKETNRLLKERNWPNTYAYTKAMGEELVRQEATKGFGNGVSTVVFRPAIVVSTAYEPLPGWIDNVYGPTGVVVAAGVGLLRTLHADTDGVANVVPVDMACNALLVAACEASKSPDSVRVYNYVSSVERPITWGQFMNETSKHGYNMPPTKSMWVYSLTLHRSFVLYLLYVAFLHFLPALVADAIFILGRKPTRLTQVYKKIYKFSNVLSYFSCGKWDFNNDNVQNLWRRLEQKDKKNFRFSISDLDWDSYFYDYICGCRLYLIKEDPKTIPEGRIRWRRMLWLHNTAKAILWVLVLYLAWRSVSSFMPSTLWKTPNMQMINESH